MNERKFDVGSLAEQIDSAKRNLESWPEWLKDSAKFQGQNHSFDGTSIPDDAAASEEGGNEGAPEAE